MKIYPISLLVGIIVASIDLSVLMLYDIDFSFVIVVFIIVDIACSMLISRKLFND